MESIYLYELKQNLAVQTWAKEWNLHDNLQSISNLLRSKNFVLYVIPLLAAIDHIFYVKILILAACAQYISILLKWLIPETRPFWWMKENMDLITVNTTLINGHEFCEPSSGFPSGHTLFITVMMYTVVKFYKTKIDKFRTNLQNSLQMIPICTVASSILLAIILSRMNLGVHFFHQCLAGFVIGCVFCHLYFSYPVVDFIQNLTTNMALIIASAMCLTIAIIYKGKQLIGIDPVWDVKMAFKWCNDPINVNVEGTAIYGFACIIGIIVGLSFAVPLKQWKHFELDYFKTFPATIVVMVLQSVAVDIIPRRYGAFLFYTLIFLTYSTYTFVLACVMPKLCKLKINRSN